METVPNGPLWRPVGSWFTFADPAEPSLLAVRVVAAHHEWNHVAITLLAMEQGYFKRHGLARVHLLTAGGEESQLRGIVDGSFDFGVDPLTRLVLQAGEREEDLAIIAPRRAGHTFLLYGQKGMKSVDDLRGTTMIVDDLNGATDLIARQILIDHGLTPDRDIQIRFLDQKHISLKLADHFFRGVTSAMMAEEAIAEELDRRGYPMLVDTRKEYPPRQDRITVARRSLAREQPEVVRAFLLGTIEASRFLLDRSNKEEVLAAVRRAGFEPDLDQFYQLMEALYRRVSSDYVLPMDGLIQCVKEEIQGDRLGAGFDVGPMLELAPLHQAQAELGISSAAAR